MDQFSKRFGFDSVEEVDIVVREDAPEDLRSFSIQIAYQLGFKPDQLRSFICQLLRKTPDRNNWSDSNVIREVEDLVMDCKWYKVYDLIEKLADHFANHSYRETSDYFESEVNAFFIENGIGWKLVNSILEIRGPESFETIVKEAQLSESRLGHVTASKELHEAIKDMSRRPVPDTTGAIQHAMASLECVAREVTGDNKANLGDIMKKYSSLIPQPLDQAVVKAWGFASEYGRHIREGREPAFSEAELIVGICAAVGSYVSKLNQVAIE